MDITSLTQQRRWFYIGVLAVFGLGVYWYFFSPGLGIWWGPSARAESVAAGRELFEHEWTPNDPLAHGDGLGPVFNAKACASCHFQGGLGGGGELQHNAVGFEVLPRPGDDNFHTGSIHNFSVKAEHRESIAVVRKRYPPLEERTARTNDPHCPTVQILQPAFDPLRTESIQTTALFGAGWIDLISDKAIRHNQQGRITGGAFREFAGDFNAIPVGRLRVLPNGRVGKFGWKGQTATLSEFVAMACSNEIGLGTPTVPQAKPLKGASPTVEPDLNHEQFGNLVDFIKMLPCPVETKPDNPRQREAAERGKELFTTVGCAACHVPDLGGVKGVYSDFLLYTLEDTRPNGSGGGYGPEPPPAFRGPPRPDDEPKPSEWKTPPLWGVADSAPYFHDGSAATLRDAVLKHKGDGRDVSAAFSKLSADDQNALLAFLKTLKAPPDALPLRNPAMTKLARVGS